MIVDIAPARPDGKIRLSCGAFIYKKILRKNFPHFKFSDCR